MACRCLSLYRTCQIDGTSVQQEFLCQRCFSGIRMRNDRKSSSSFNFTCYISHCCFLHVLCSIDLFYPIRLLIFEKFETCNPLSLPAHECSHFSICVQTIAILTSKFQAVKQAAILFPFPVQSLLFSLAHRYSFSGLFLSDISFLWLLPSRSVSCQNPDILHKFSEMDMLFH